MLKFVFPRFTQTGLCILYTLRLQRQVRYCDMLYAHSNTMRDTKHRGFGFNCATRSNTQDGDAIVQIKRYRQSNKNNRERVRERFARISRKYEEWYFVSLEFVTRMRIVFRI